MVVDTSLTEAMLQRLAKIDPKCKEGGKDDDPTRLCASWKGAFPEDKTELERLSTDRDLASKCSASKIKEEHPKHRICTTACIQNAIGNYRKKAKAAVDRREESKL